MKLINEVLLNLTGTVFGITGKPLPRNGTSLNLTEIMFEITENHFNTIRKGGRIDLI
jgi:hypothetical protein